MHVISKESRSNSMIFEQRGQYNKNKRTEEKKKYCSNGIWNSKIDISDPDSFAATLVSANDQVGACSSQRTCLLS